MRFCAVCGERLPEGDFQHTCSTFRPLRLAVFAALFLAACAARRPVPMPPAAAALIEAPYCVAMTVVEGGVEVNGKVCTDAAWSCERVRAAAEAVGSWAGIVGVGECVEAP